MKQIYTLILVLLATGIFSQTLQLDSTAVYDINGGWISSRTFNYEDELLIQISSSNTIITYDDNQKIIKWDKGDKSYELTYDNENLAENGIIYENEEKLFKFDYFYEDGKLKTVDAVLFINDQEKDFRHISYTYSGNEVQVDYYAYQGTQQVFLMSVVEIFDEQEKLVREEVYLEIDQIKQADSINYSTDGSVESIFKIQYNEGIPEPAELYAEFISDPAYSFSEIASPLNFYQKSDLFSLTGGSNSIQRAMFYANKVEEYWVKSVEEGRINKWFYSISIIDQTRRLPVTPISVFPNPCTKLIKVEVDESLIQYQIYDMSGAEIGAGNLEINAINVENLANGHYTLVCSDKDQNHYCAQFVKQ